MARDLTTVPTEELRAEYAPQLAKLRKLRDDAKALHAEIEPLKLELAEREHKATLILNAVMAGQQQLLAVAGVSKETIAAAEAQFAEIKAEKMARNAARVAAEEAVSP